ncbi:hypothetical protein OMO38_10680 [Chryseobacterium sp. 09-1422]|uniref:Oxidoreductase n=1 Tax=Chryseobacterium kimseyorum TaxID=2984028 RepID=A0ABT3HYV9_9FLAO|nr:hypothetical protein [Chryseobacterium kimseyorum]MCW3168988.1 hypothetical protein [Chryseobacterium kimseyorum]
MKISIIKPQSLFSLLIFLTILLLSCKKEEQKTFSKPASTEIKKDSLISPKINLNDFNIFEINPIDNGKEYDIFISLSDIYNDSLSLPPEIITNQKNMSFDELKHIELPLTYREKLLKRTKLMEKDTLYLYNYKANMLEKFPINSLKAVANLHVYASEGDEISEYDYMIGFQLNKTEYEEKAMEKANFVFAYFGNQNPFNEKPLTSIQWKKVSLDKFPVKTQHKTLKTGNAYLYQTEDLQYFILDLIGEFGVTERQLAVLKNRKLIFEKNYTLGEGSGFASLNGIENMEYPNYLWTGNLFKGKPPVIFGFVFQSFGCPSIDFLDQNYSEIYTKCDNRH